MKIYKEPEIKVVFTSKDDILTESNLKLGEQAFDNLTVVNWQWEE